MQGGITLHSPILWHLDTESSDVIASLGTGVSMHTSASLWYAVCILWLKTILRRKGQVSIGAAGFVLAVQERSLLQLPFWTHHRSFIQDHLGWWIVFFQVNVKLTWSSPEVQSGTSANILASRGISEYKFRFQSLWWGRSKEKCILFPSERKIENGQTDRHTHIMQKSRDSQCPSKSQGVHQRASITWEVLAKPWTELTRFVFPRTQSAGFSPELWFTLISNPLKEHINSAFPFLSTHQFLPEPF